MTQELKNYIYAYITAWQNGGDQPAAVQCDGDLPADWEFYVKNGLYASEKFYTVFLETNGISQLPDLLRVMDELQEHRKCIFLTDDDPRRLPFPPAFQAAFVEVAEREAVSDDLAKRQCVRAVFETLQSLGMTRIHQSTTAKDVHVLPIPNWLSFLDRANTKEFSQLNEDSRKAKYYYECAAAYAKSWIAIHFEMERWTFSPSNEKHIAEEYFSDWMHTLRTCHFSSCVYTRCLETTDIRSLPILLAYIYVADQHRAREYISLDFERALATFCLKYANEVHKPENYLSLAKALTILKEDYEMTTLREEPSLSDVLAFRARFGKLNEESWKPSLAHMIRNGMWKPTLEEYARVGMRLSEFDVESWSDTFMKIYNSFKKNEEDTGKSIENDIDSDQTPPTDKPRKWLHAGWAVYRRIRGLGGTSESPSGNRWPWCMKPPSLFVYPSKAYNVVISLFAGVFVSALAYGIRYRIGQTADCWPWIGVLIGSALCVFLIRELHVFLSCRTSGGAIKDFWEMILMILLNFLGVGAMLAVLCGIKCPANCWALVVNYWALVGVMIGSALCVFLIRELDVFLSCCVYAATISSGSWEKDEASYLKECRKEYCLNSYGGNIIEGPEFKFAAHCSAVLSRFIGWMGPILEAHGDAGILYDIIGVSYSAQRSLFRKSLPHAGKEWPLTPKKSAKQ